VSEAKFTPMVIAAARALCKSSSEVCNVDYEDNWKLYGGEFLIEAERALAACGANDLLEALQAVVDAFQFTNESPGQYEAIQAARAAISRATGQGEDK